MHFTIRVRVPGSDRWEDLCIAGHVMQWRSEERAEAYAKRVRLHHPDWSVRVYGWIDAFSI